MAPEQLEGREADARTDVFALGAVLYEMATGRRPFEGRSQASLIAAILEREPVPISAIQPTTPPALDRVIKTCLAKDPEDRFQTAHDVGLQLKWIAEGGATTGPAPPPGRRSGRRGLWAGSAGFLLGAALAIIALRVFVLSRPSRTPTPTRFVLSAGEQNPIVFATWNPLALSRDGRLLAAVVSRAGGGGSQLFLHRFEDAGWTLVPGSEGAGSPAFSPDGEWVAFFARGKIMKVPVSGGTPLAICESGPFYGVAWADDVIWFGSTAGLMKVSASGGKPQLAVPVQKGELSLRRPQLLPGGKSILFLTFLEALAPGTRIEAVSLETGRRRVLVEGGYQPVYAPTGHLIYIPEETGGQPVAVPFDAKRLQIVGTPAPALTEGAAYYAISETGTLAYVSSTAARFNSMAWVDRSGKVQPLPAPPHFFEQPRLSPDGRSVAVSSREGEMDIWVYSIERGTLVRFTSDPLEDETPLWTPDGQRIAFRRAGKIFWKAADGSGGEELLASSTVNWHLSSFSPDGRLLALYAMGSSGEDIYVLPIGPNARLEPVLQTPANEKSPAFSPDGHWFAYSSDESGRDEVYIQAFPGPGRKVQISTDGGGEPVWARDGREIFFRSGDHMMAVDLRTGEPASASAPHVLFSGRFAHAHRDYTNYDVSPDGKRFLMIQGQEQGIPQLNIVLDWFTELSQRAPRK